MGWQEKRWLWSLIVCWLGMGLGARCLGAETPAATRWNVVLILADDLGWSDLGCYGADLHETPHLDRLAREGVRFTQAYAAPVCSPTRACLLTGRHYARLHTTIWREAAREPPRDRPLVPPASVADLPYEELTLAEVFRDAGYLTALIGKWHLGGASHYPETQGFDINIGGTLWGAPATYFFPYRSSAKVEGEFRYVPHLAGGQAGEYLTDRLTDEALRVIDGAGERPFFLYLAHHAVHSPIEGKPALVEKYRGKLRPELRHRNAEYAAMVESLDESVGRILERLESRGLAERTVVLFLSDNGGRVVHADGKFVTDNYPLRSGKGSVYEGGVRIPLIVRWPGRTREPVTCDEPVYVGDVFPTLVRLPGMASAEPTTAASDGVDLTPLLKDVKAKLGREALYYHYPHYYPTTTPASAIRVGDWKLVEYHDDRRVELYDLAHDLGESRDLAAQEPRRAAELRERLEAWRQAVDAQMPVPNPEYRPGP